MILKSVWNVDSSGIFVNLKDATLRNLIYLSLNDEKRYQNAENAHGIHLFIRKEKFNIMIWGPAKTVRIPRSPN